MKADILFHITFGLPMSVRRSSRTAELSALDHRSWNMSRIRGKNTKPEMIVRRLLHAEGFRYRLHAADLPGRPDIVFRSRKKVIFVHGCFWHQHDGCRNAVMPKTRTEFWSEKLGKNVSRDQSVLSQLREKGWKALIIWECQTSQPEIVREMFKEFLA